MKRRELIQKVENAIKINRKLFRAVIILQGILLLFLLAKPLLYRAFLDSIIKGQKWNFLCWIFLSYLLLAILEMAGKVLAIRLKNRLFFSILLQIRKKIWNAFAGETVQQASRKAGDRKLRMDEDAEKVCAIYYAQRADYVVQSGIAACSLAFMAFTEWHLSLMAVFCIPITVGLNAYLGRKEQVLTEENRKNSEEINDWIQKDMVAWKQKKLLQTEQADIKFFQNYLHQYADYFSHWITYWTMRSLVIPQLKNEFVMKLGVYVLGGYFIARGSLEISGMLVFITYYTYFVSAVQEISDRKTEIIEEYPSVKRVVELFDCAKVPVENTLAEPIKRIAVENLSFSYPSADDVLCRLNLKMERGNIFLLRGKSGSGKSTLLSVLAKIYPYERGSILVNDGMELSEFGQEEWFQRISCYRQEMVLFADTIRENLYDAKPNASDQEIIEALQMADAWEFVKDMEHGIDTELSENGSNLSGGQRQRILLARTLLKSADVYFFDEPTSALDPERESRVMEVLEKLAKRKVVFVITHQECEE